MAGPSRTGSVRAGVLVGLRGFLARYPTVDLDALLREIGLDPRALDATDAWIDQARWIALQEAIARAAGDPTFGIEFALAMPWRDLGILGYVVLHSPTLGAALENSARYLACQQTGGRFTLEVDGRVARFRYAIVDPRIRVHGQNTEGAFALVVRMARERTPASRWAPVKVQLTHPRPRRTAAQARFFGAPVQYGATTNTLAFRAADLALPLRTADPDLLPILLSQAADRLADHARPTDLRATVGAAIGAALAAGTADIGEVARRLDQRPRTLQRHLRAGGVSYRELVEATRLELARGYLAGGALSLTDIAFALGYADLSAFSRAFRRWTGAAPRTYRRRPGPRR
ncbi:MAG: AraC family transcriptional regulator [Myxococcales bacterium]|nr:AraC family transcriptional regulator [Myxococcales bacterium]